MIPQFWWPSCHIDTSLQVGQYITTWQSQYFNFRQFLSNELCCELLVSYFTLMWLPKND